MVGKEEGFFAFVLAEFYFSSKDRSGSTIPLICGAIFQLWFRQHICVNSSFLQAGGRTGEG